MPMVISIEKKTLPSEIEAKLASVDGEMAAWSEADRSLEIRLPSESNQIFADVWFSIFTGTMAANWPTTIVAWGMSKLDFQNTIVRSLAGLAALRTATKIVPERSKKQPLNGPLTLSQLSGENRGLVSTSGGAQTLLEIDPDLPRAPALRAPRQSFNPSMERRKMFAQLILYLRKQVEIGALRRSIDPVSEGPSGAVGRFLFELHENGLEHGSRSGDGRIIPGSRLLRVRKHVASTPDELVNRHGGMPFLKSYLEKADVTALVEASISDFGLGIVDGFLSTAVGSRYKERNRRELLDGLLYKRLSSKGTDPASGLGIQRALRAAYQMNAFVSLRTAEFWLTASFSSANPEFRMVDVDPNTKHGSVRGTHWQFLWPQP